MPDSISAGNGLWQIPFFARFPWSLQSFQRGLLPPCSGRGQALRSFPSGILGAGPERVDQAFYHGSHFGRMAAVDFTAKGGGRAGEEFRLSIIVPVPVDVVCIDEGDFQRQGIKECFQLF